MLGRTCGRSSAVLRVAVVGSGPSGVYTAQSLVQQSEVPGVRVDVLDRLPCPYGLVRYGVAPGPREDQVAAEQSAHGPGGRAGALPRRRRGRPGRRCPRPAAGAVPRGRVLRGRRHRPASGRAGRGAAGQLVGDRVRVLVQRASGLRGRGLRARRVESAVVIGVGQRRRGRDPDPGPRRGRAERPPTCRRRRSARWPTAGCADVQHGGAARPVAGPLHHQGAARAGHAAGHRSGRGSGRVGARPGVRRPVAALPAGATAATWRCCAAGPTRPRAGGRRRIRLRFFLRPVELLGGRGGPGGARCASSGRRRTAAAG